MAQTKRKPKKRQHHSYRSVAKKRVHKDHFYDPLREAGWSLLEGIGTGILVGTVGASAGILSAHRSVMKQHRKNDIALKALERDTKKFSQELKQARRGRPRKRAVSNTTTPKAKAVSKAKISAASKVSRAPITRTPVSANVTLKSATKASVKGVLKKTPYAIAGITAYTAYRKYRETGSVKQALGAATETAVNLGTFGLYAGAKYLLSGNNSSSKPATKSAPKTIHVRAEMSRMQKTAASPASKTKAPMKKVASTAPRSDGKVKGHYRDTQNGRIWIKGHVRKAA